MLGTIWSGGCFHEAEHTPLPQVEDSGGPVLASPQWAIITFADDPLGDAIDTFTLELATSRYWKAIVSEYGVKPATVVPVTLQQPAPSTIDEAGIQQLLASHIEPLAAGWPAVDANTVYVVYFPATTTVAGYCGTGPAGRHSQFQSSKGTPVPYVVIPRCLFGDPLDSLTATTSHELAEATTDPVVISSPAFLKVSDYAWGQLSLGSEIGDMCEYTYGAYFVDPELKAYVQRIWSNAQAASGHDPCVPHPSGDLYFQAAPDLPDTVTVAVSPITMPVVTRGVIIPVGASRTITVDIFSDQPTAPISVFAYEVPIVPVAEQPASVTFSWDRVSGSNGDILHLTVSVAADYAGEGHEYFVITSQLGDVQQTWPVVIANQ